MTWLSKILLFMACSVIGYTGVLFGLDLYRYYSLSHQAPVCVTSWEVKEVAAGSFAVEATFTAGGKERQYQFVKPQFKNKFIAEKHAELWAKEIWDVYSNRDEFVLQKFFPFMKGIHFILSIGVVLWFMYLFEASSGYKQDISEIRRYR